MNAKRNAFTIFFSIFILMGCESKVSEKRAQTYSGEYSADQIVKINSEFDKKMQQVQSSVDQIKNLIQQLQNNLVNQKDSVFISVFDIVNQYNESIKNQLPNLAGQQLFLEGSLKIKLDKLTSDCQDFNYFLYSSSVMPLDKIEYSMSSCFTGRAMLNILNVNFKNNKLNLDFNSENLKKLLPEDYIRPEVPQCEIPEKSIQGTVCKSVVFGQSAQLVWVSDIEIGEKLIATFYAQSKKTLNPIYKGQLVLNSKGVVESFEIKPTEFSNELILK